jgi:hypothetical protein
MELALGLLCALIIMGFLYQLHRTMRHRELEARFGALNEMFVHFQGANKTIVDTMLAMEGAMSVQRAVLDEVVGNNQKMEKASDLLHVQRSRVMKLLHHAVVANSDDPLALKSCWALATELGDEESLDLMVRMEPLRDPHHLLTFREYRSILEKRLGGKVAEQGARR